MQFGSLSKAAKYGYTHFNSEYTRKLAVILTNPLALFCFFNNCLFPQNNNLNIFVTQVGGGGVFYKVLNREAPSQGPLPLVLLRTFVPFDRKGTSFVDLSLQKGTCNPLQIYLRILHPFSIPLESLS